MAAVLFVGLTVAVAQAFGRFTFGVLLPAVRDDLGLSNTVAGTLATVNVAAYLVGTVVFAAVASSYRLLTVLRVGLLFSVAGLFTAALSPNALVLALGLTSMGFGGALIWIPAPVVAADALAPKRRSYAIAIVSSGIGAGVVFSGQLAFLVRSSQGDTVWRPVYLIEAAIGIVAVLGAWMLLPQRDGEPSARSGFGGFNVLRRMAGWVPYTIAYTSFGLMYLLVLAFLTSKLEDDNGWSASSASLAFTIMGIAMVIGGPLFIAIAGRTTTRVALIGAFGGWMVMTAILIPGWTVPTYVAAFIEGLIFAALPALMTVYIVDHTTTQNYGPSFAAATFAFGVAQMISPQLGGYIADLAGSFTPVFALSIAIAGVGLIAVIALPKERRVPKNP